MPGAPSDGATTSATALRAPRFRFLRNLSQLIGDSSSPLFTHTNSPQSEASILSQDPDDINVPPTQAQGPSSNVRPSATPVIVGTPLTAPHYRAIKIPYLRKSTYVFPDASTSISQAHRDRFPALKDILQRNIESSPELCDYTTCISYELRMCGSCVADAFPSILVFCPFVKLKKIKSLFTQPHLKSQLEPEYPTSTFVHFGLFFWARTTDMLAFHEIAVVIPEEQNPGECLADAGVGNVPWGLQVFEEVEHGEQHTATVGCTIRIGSQRFGLTTAHAFHHSPTAGPRDHDLSSGDSDTEDEEYDMSMEEDNNQLSMETLPLPSGRTVKLGKCQVHTPPPIEDSSAWMRDHANLDWALFELESNGARLPTYSAADEALDFAESLPEGCTDVMIITLPFSGVPATLYNIPSYLGGAKGSQAAEVWTVGCLSEETPIRKGDSGSIVVGARSGELYGMVVAANPFGDIHIAPFATILAQVRELFDVQDACVLKTPLHLVSPVLDPSLETNSLIESRNARAQETVVHEGGETLRREAWVSPLMQEFLPEDGPLIIHEPDVEIPVWASDDKRRRPPFPPSEEPISKPTPNSKMEPAESMMTAPSTSENSPFFSELHTVDIFDAEDFHPRKLQPLTREHLSLKLGDMPSLIRDIQAWVNDELD